MRYNPDEKDTIYCGEDVYEKLLVWGEACSFPTLFGGIRFIKNGLLEKNQIVTFDPQLITVMKSVESKV